jgi:hypothetical protein
VVSARVEDALLELGFTPAAEFGAFMTYRRRAAVRPHRGGGQLIKRPENLNYLVNINAVVVGDLTMSHAVLCPSADAR